MDKGICVVDHTRGEGGIEEQLLRERSISKTVENTD